MAPVNRPQDRLLKARLEAGYLDRRALCEAVGWKYPTYSSHENGSRPLSRKAAETYGKKFGVSGGWLLYGEPSRIDELPEPVRALVNHALNSPPEVVQAALAMFRSLAGRASQLTAVNRNAKTSG